MKMEGFPSTWCPPRLVIPAHAGIQVCCAELAWIPAFAGMMEPRRASWFSSPNGYFRRRHEGHEGFRRVRFAHRSVSEYLPQRTQRAQRKEIDFRTWRPWRLGAINCLAVVMSNISEVRTYA